MFLIDLLAAATPVSPPADSSNLGQILIYAGAAVGTAIAVAGGVLFKPVLKPLWQTASERRSRDSSPRPPDNNADLRDWVEAQLRTQKDETRQGMTYLATAQKDAHKESTDALQKLTEHLQTIEQKMDERVRTVDERLTEVRVQLASLGSSWKEKG